MSDDQTCFSKGEKPADGKSFECFKSEVSFIFKFLFKALYVEMELIM
jgi:hypothetical protein